MTTPTVRFLVEDGFVVRGTQDPHVALASAVGDEDFEIQYWSAEYAKRIDDAEEMPAKSDVDALADNLHELLAEARAGFYRWVPASVADRESEGITQWLRRVDGPGRGVFEGVMFR